MVPDLGEVMQLLRELAPEETRRLAELLRTRADQKYPLFDPRKAKVLMITTYVQAMMRGDSHEVATEIAHRATREAAQS